MVGDEVFVNYCNYNPIKLKKIIFKVCHKTLLSRGWSRNLILRLRGARAERNIILRLASL